MALRFSSGRGGILALVGLGLVLASSSAQGQCVGDCNHDNRVIVNELIVGVNIVLERQPKSACPEFQNPQGNVDVAQLIKGVNNALSGCPATPTATATETAEATATHTEIVEATATSTVPEPIATATATTAEATATATAPEEATATATVPEEATATATAPEDATATATAPEEPTATATAPEEATATATGSQEATATATVTVEDTATATATETVEVAPTPTVTPVPCPLEPGRYVQTTLAGTLRVATFAPFPFPPGGTTIQDIGAGDANCVHETVVPFPGGLTVPAFCVPALGATTMVTQTGCGIGRIDSNGGSDFTIDEKGDTSETTICNVSQGATCPASGPAPDSSGRLDVTVGDGTPDTCTGSSTANAVVTIPVDTLTWVAANETCPDTDGEYTDGVDTKLAQFPQTLDLTTDTATARFADINADTCTKSGLGPIGPFTNTGTCIDIAAQTVTVAAAGTIFSSGGPTFDLLFTTKQPATIAQPTANEGATCASPPQINFGGLQTRCLVAP